MAKRISIINFKGGVGKTTLAFHLGTGLARYHNSKVLLVDMDHQSSLSILCLGASAWEQAVNDRRTVDEVFKDFVGSSSKSPGKEIITLSPMKSSAYSNMDLVPASLHLDDTEIELTASHQGNAIQSEWNKRTLICKWLEHAAIDDNYDYIIFDCPPATKVVSQNAIAASHGYIIPVVPEAVMERGAPHLREMIRSGIDTRLKALATMGEARNTFVPDTQLVALAITRIQSSGGYSGYTNDHSQHLSSMQRSWGDALAQPYILQGTGVSQALADGIPVYDSNDSQNITRRGIDRQFKKLTENLKKRIDIL
ncbi:MAG: ParA family protein [Caldilineaceae bacterium]|nr:ParA family protein [Caldilineaceae bacterium]MBP8107887.1 ParA family protein [Caldilineaceae bacterium]MBP8122652.1 ParA family protein [Caldilineaceae bacterium]MBP9071046.1 ParA family protein [Caldilineaceae bacterium]